MLMEKYHQFYGKDSQKPNVPDLTAFGEFSQPQVPEGKWISSIYSRESRKNEWTNGPSAPKSI